MTTREEIENLARDNFTVAHCVAMYRTGRVSWEDAMMTAVVVLAKINCEQNEMLEKSVMLSVSPPAIVLDLRGLSDIAENVPEEGES